jgi:hypothetical protein
MLKEGEEWCFNELFLIFRMFVRMFTETKKDNHGGVKRILL